MYTHPFAHPLTHPSPLTPSQPPYTHARTDRQRISQIIHTKLLLLLKTHTLFFQTLSHFPRHSSTRSCPLHCFKGAKYSTNKRTKAFFRHNGYSCSLISRSQITRKFEIDQLQAYLGSVVARLGIVHIFQRLGPRSVCRCLHGLIGSDDRLSCFSIAWPCPPTCQPSELANRSRTAGISRY